MTNKALIKASGKSHRGIFGIVSLFIGIYIAIMVLQVVVAQQQANYEECLRLYDVCYVLNL